MNRSALTFGGLAAAVFAVALTAAAEPPAGFKLDGERFAYKDDKLSLSGVFLKPEGKGPFPAVLISHGLGGNPDGFGLPKAREFVKWGFVCIAPEYTHAGKAAGDRKTFGASAENLARAAKCVDILTGLPYVDAKRVCAYGNSMGAFVTIGLAAAIPDRLAACAITAGGTAPRAGFPAPSHDEAAKIRTPFLILHGTADTTVRPEQSAALAEALEKSKTTHTRRLFEGVGHGLHNEKSAEVYKDIRAWFERHAGKK
jgi:dienelactone hydrolase